MPALFPPNRAVSPTFVTPSDPENPPTGAPKSRAFHLCLLLIAVFGFLGAPSLLADDESLGFFKARKVEREAKQALASGQAGAAAEAYARLAEGTDAGSERHGRALHGAAVAELLRPEGEADRSMARLWLDRFLADYPSHPEIGSARALRAALGAAAPAPQVVAVVGEEEPSVDEEAGEAKSARVKVLEGRVAQLRAELRSAKEELAKKDEALEKLKEVVVGGGGR